MAIDWECGLSRRIRNDYPINVLFVNKVSSPIQIRRSRTLQFLYRSFSELKSHSEVCVHTDALLFCILVNIYPNVPSKRVASKNLKSRFTNLVLDNAESRKHIPCNRTPNDKAYYKIIVKHITSGRKGLSAIIRLMQYAPTPTASCGFHAYAYVC